MIENFATLEDIFADSSFDELVKEIHPKKIDRLDPDIEKFQEIVEWVRENGNQPTKARNITERKLYSRLKGIRNKPEDWTKYLNYDVFGLLKK